MFRRVPQRLLPAYTPSMQSAKLAWELLDRGDKRRFWVLLVLMVINGGLEMCGMGLVLPYIGIIGDPGLIHRNASLEGVYRFLGLANFNQFVVLLSFLLFGMFLFKNAFGLFLQNLLLRFAFLKQLDLGRMQMRICIVRPYEYFLTHNSADIVRNLTSSIPSVCAAVIVPWLTLLTDLVMTAGLLVLIVYIQPVAALAAIGVIGPLSYLIFRACRHRVLHYGTEQNREYRAMVKHSTEALQGIKEIKASGRGDYFVDRYLESSRLYLRAMRLFSFVGNVPRAVLETAMVGAITLVVLVMMWVAKGQLQNAVPLLAVYAAAGVRVMPACNRMIIALNSIRFHTSTLEIVSAEVRESQRLNADERAPAKTAQMPFQRALDLDEIGFRYEGSSEMLFDGLSLRINRGESVAFIGRSGSGKSTLVDLILGLLSPLSGTVKVDGREISEDPGPWQKQVGYIPQQIYLVDDTLARNVALGLTESEMDLDRLRRVIAMADLQDLVNDLPLGLDTLIGEHGVMLSGGQRQRLGIARALYRQPSLLIMDEATSALDNISERKVIEAISALGDSVTVIMVAHRLSTVKYCDRVFLLDKGRIIDSGNYEKIAERHPYFINPAGGSANPATESIHLV